ncbi:hypothetical protein QTP86_003179 [Hemibagrus guttatus]|nr:hypothetical protein QTP86_003179 [Hemibagrus guttatus]
MGKRKDLSEFDKGQIVMARPLDQSISKTAALVGCSRSAVCWLPQAFPLGCLVSSTSPKTCQLAAGTCEIVTLDRDSSQPRRTIARQTARCACRKGQIAGTTRASPACVDGMSQAAFIQALVPLYD